MKNLLGVAVVVLVTVAVWMFWPTDTLPPADLSPEERAKTVPEASKDKDRQPRAVEASAETEDASKDLPGNERTRIESSPEHDGPTRTIRLLRFGTEEPVPDAEVYYEPPGFSWESIPEAQRDRSGRDLEFRLREYGKKLIADANGQCTVPLEERFASVVARLDTLYGQGYLRRDTKGPVVIHMRIDRTLRVRVLDSQDRPAEGVRVMARKPDQRHGMMLGKTDPAGEITYPHFQNWAGDKPALSTEVFAAPAGGEGPKKSFNAAEPPEEPIELRLPPTGRIEIQFLLSDGKPFPRQYMGQNATVAIGFFDQKPTARQARSQGHFQRPLDENSQVVIPHVVLGKHIAINQYRLLRSPRIMRGPTARQPRLIVPIKLDADDVIFAGRALDQGGKHLAEANIRLVCKYRRGSGTTSGATDKEGRFLVPLPWMKPGREVEIYVHQTPKHDEARLLAKVARPWTVVPGINRLGDLVFGEDPLVLSGKVIFPEGIKPHRLWWSVERQVSDRYWTQEGELQWLFKEEGSFEVRGVVEAGAKLRLKLGRCPYRVVEPREYVPGATGIEIRLQASGSLRAEFLKDASTPWEQLVCMVERETSGTKKRRDPFARFHNRLYLRPKGESRLTGEQVGLTPGTYRLTVKCPGFSEPLVRVEGIHVPPSGGEVDDPRLKGLDLRGLVRTIQISVQTPEGRPLRDEEAMVIVTHDPANLYGYRLGTGTVKVLIKHQPARIRILAQGYAMKELDSVNEDRVVKLEPAIKQVFRIRWPFPLPEGVVAGIYLQPRPPDVGRGASLRYANGGRGALNAMSAEGTFGPDGTATVRPLMKGLHGVRLTLREGSDGPRHYLYAITPREVKISKGGGPIEIKISETNLRKRVAGLKR